MWLCYEILNSFFFLFKTLKTRKINDLFSPGADLQFVFSWFAHEFKMRVLLESFGGVIWSTSGRVFYYSSPAEVAQTRFCIFIFGFGKSRQRGARKPTLLTSKRTNTSCRNLKDTPKIWICYYYLVHCLQNNTGIIVNEGLSVLHGPGL